MKKTLVILLAFFSLTSHAQQDPLYSQYQFNQLMINPAYAGIYNRLSVGAISRFQWAGIEGSPRTNTITAQSALADGKIGLGAVVLNDRFGVSNNYEVQFASSYNIKFNSNTKLAMGIQGGFVQFGYDFSKVNLDFFDDPEIVNGHDNFTKPNFGVGFMLLNPNFFIGASAPRILNVSITDGSTQSERYKRHYYLTAGIAAEIQQTPVKATTLIRSMAGETYSFDVTLSAFLEDVMWAGISVRDLKHFGVLGILALGENLKLGYSFELPTNNLIHGNYGTHEVSISYGIRYGYGRQEPIFF
ncbi:PorP/SprF family type IX secretion system membrane protein [Ekhidna sp. To15]|uniref:PorP/SprF family type IX secretion system membrane protein n=1 Tax=Ekhidna sp. To15 TaxID=3395267 RepID=UPI003F51E475